MTNSFEFAPSGAPEQESSAMEKEPFDIQELTEISDVVGPFGKKLTPERIAELQERYESNPKFTTISEFADHLAFMDAYDVS